jgi:hypothetical protein
VILKNTQVCALVLSGLASIVLAGESEPLSKMKENATALSDVVSSDLAREMLSEVESLPIIEGRTIYAAWRPNRGYTQTQYDALDESDREGLRERSIDAMGYYSTFYGSPLVYARMLDLVVEYEPEWDIEGAKVLDLGYGQLGQLRLWAQMGADVVGIEVDPILTAIYDGCEAVGDVDGDPETSGSVELIEGAWPNEPGCRDEVGTGYDLFVSRNLLKRGYVKPDSLNPAFPVPVGWGMSDEEMLGHVFELMNDGGMVVIVSLGPQPDPNKAWSNISNPWEERAWIDAGFEVLAHDADESPTARAMGKALGWGEQMNLVSDLFAVYSVYRKPISD